MTFGNGFLGGLVDSGFSALGGLVGSILAGMGASRTFNILYN